MGIPFVAQLGFAEVDSSGPIVALAGTTDAAVQYYRLIQSVNGVITIPDNTKHKKIILDVNGKTIGGGGPSPIIHNNDSIELTLRGSGFITSSGSLPFSGSGTGSATVDSATQGLGSTGSVVIATSDNTPKYPNVDSDAQLVQRRVTNISWYNYGSSYYPYHYYPDYYSGSPADDKPHHYTHTEVNNGEYTGGSTYFTQMARLIGDVNPGGTSANSSSIWSGSNHLDPGYLIIVVPYNGVTVELQLPPSNQISSNTYTPSQSHPYTHVSVYNANQGFNFTSGSGTGVLTRTIVTSGGVSGELPIPAGSPKETKYEWAVSPSGNSAFTIVAHFLTAQNNAIYTSTNGWSNAINGLFFGLGSAFSPLPSGTRFRMPLKGTYVKGKKAVVQNNNDNSINFSVDGGADSSVPANDSATVANLTATAESWSFSGEKPTDTSVDQTSGIAVGISAVNIDTENQTVALDWVDNPLGFSDGNSDRRNGGWIPRIPSGMSFIMNDGTVYAGGTYCSINIASSGPGLTPYMTQAHVTELFGSNGSKLSLSGVSPHGVLGGTFSNLTTATFSSGAANQFYEILIPGNTAGYTTSLRYYSSGAVIFRDHVSVTAGNGSGQITSGTVSGVKKRIVGTKFINNTGVILSNFTSGGSTPSTLAVADSAIIETAGLTAFSATQPSVNSAGNPLAPAAAFTGTGVSNNDSGTPIDGVDLTAFTGTINSIRSGAAPSTTYVVTVAAKASYDSGSANAFYIDGVERPTLALTEGNTYFFIQSDASNAGGGTHPLRFSTTANGTHGGGTEYTTGVTTVGTLGTLGAYTKITVAVGAPTLYYYCSNHSNMGGQLNT